MDRLRQRLLARAAQMIGVRVLADHHDQPLRRKGSEQPVIP